MSEEKYVDPKTVNLIELVKDGKVVRFAYFRDNEFWYRHEDGLLFPISVEEATAGKATFMAEDKAMFFLRWIRRYVSAAKLG